MPSCYSCSHNNQYMHDVACPKRYNIVKLAKQIEKVEDVVEEIIQEVVIIGKVVVAVINDVEENERKLEEVDKEVEDVVKVIVEEGIITNFKFEGVNNKIEEVDKEVEENERKLENLRKEVESIQRKMDEMLNTIKQTVEVKGNMLVHGDISVMNNSSDIVGKMCTCGMLHIDKIKMGDKILEVVSENGINNVLKWGGVTIAVAPQPYLEHHIGGGMGGYSAYIAATDKEQGIADSIKYRVEALIGSYPMFKAISYSYQIVNGTNYNIIVQVSDNKYTNINVYVPLSGPIIFTSVRDVYPGPLVIPTPVVPI